MHVEAFNLEKVFTRVIVILDWRCTGHGTNVVRWLHELGDELNWSLVRRQSLSDGVCQ